MTNSAEHLLHIADRVVIINLSIYLKITLILLTFSHILISYNYWNIKILICQFYKKYIQLKK